MGGSRRQGGTRALSRQVVSSSAAFADGRRLAIEVEGPSHDLYIYDFECAVLANITTDGVSHWPVWSPDGHELGYRSGPMGHFTLWRVPADRSREPQKVPATGTSQNAESWSPEGRRIAYTAQAPGVPPTIMVAHLDGNEAEPLSEAKQRKDHRSFHLAADGWRIVQTNPESLRCTCRLFRGQVPRLRSRAIAAPIGCGGLAAASCTIATATA
jgi:Tol biopolymer transport system component